MGYPERPHTSSRPRQHGRSPERGDVGQSARVSSVRLCSIADARDCKHPVDRNPDRPSRASHAPHLDFDSTSRRSTRLFRDTKRYVACVWQRHSRTACKVNQLPGENWNAQGSSGSSLLGQAIECVDSSARSRCKGWESDDGSPPIEASTFALPRVGLHSVIHSV